jgi:hypothetical protein
MRDERMRVWRRRCAVPWAAPREDPPRSRWHIPFGSLAGLRKGLQLFSRRDSEGTYQTVLGLFVVEASLTIELPKW